MSIEWVSTIGSLLTVLIVGATAIAALVQLRHMRAGNQINAILTIGEKFMEPRYQDARAFVTTGLDQALQDSLPRARHRAFEARRAARYLSGATGDAARGESGRQPV